MSDLTLDFQAEPVASLNRAFMLDYPAQAARRLETLETDEAVATLTAQPAAVVAPVVSRIAPGAAFTLVRHLPPDYAAELLCRLDTGPAVTLLNRFDEAQREQLFARMSEGNVTEFRSLLEYPEDTAGRLMDTDVIAFHEQTTVAEALTQIRQQQLPSLHHLFLLNDTMQLIAEVDLSRILLAPQNQPLGELAVPVPAFVQFLDPREEVAEKLETHQVDWLPVVDSEHRLVGIIEGRDSIDVMRDELTADLQTMVGASKDERALSSAWFTVRKRLPWLQINLLTAFLAAAVVGVFEDTIAKYTALAILLPIAAGQSGNTGAQALAVTMRGLTLREITVRHWLRVTFKEAGAALINGAAIALTCGVGVYFWSGSTGLALIIALAMVSSMLIAAVSGALVPIVLKRMGQDPALSSSIILTTITDIAGFMSFLGIATLLSGMLAAP